MLYSQSGIKGRRKMSYGKFMASDVANISGASSVADGAGFTAIPLDVCDQQIIKVQIHAKGSASGCSAAVIAKFVGSVDGALYDTEVWSSCAVTLNGVNEVVASERFRVRGYKSIKPVAISNVDTSNASNVGILWGKEIS